MNRPEKPHPSPGEDDFQAHHSAWEQRVYQPYVNANGEWKTFTTQAMHWPVKAVYTPADLDAAGFDYLRDVGFPGEFPYTRGISPNGN